MACGDLGLSWPVHLSPIGREGVLGLPAGRARGMVLFAHGSDSNGLIPRNDYVAAELRKAGLATLLFDLLSESEVADRANAFDIPLLAARLVEATQWARCFDESPDFPIGYFGAGTGAAAALVASTRLGGAISAVVSRSGRLDLAENALARVFTPTLLIVGAADTEGLALNRRALRQLRWGAKLEVVPGAVDLSDERGALEPAVMLARHWLVDHLAGARAWVGAGTLH